MTRRRILLWGVLPGVLILGAAVVIAPYLSANQFRPRIQSALEHSLRREVKVGEVHFTLLHGPGFQADDVLIRDTPGAGIEPFAYVSSLEASLRFTSFFTGHFVFSTLRLDEPTVNLVKTQSGMWNVQEFMNGDSAAAAKGGGDLPDIQIRSGRLNFKFGDVKSVFYVSNADVDIYRADANSIGIRFLGEPARTDRAAAGFGSVSGRGLLKSGTDSEAQLSLGLALERSNLADMVTLIDGHDIGIHGFVTAAAHLAGPLSRIGITGDLELSDLHRWDLIPAEASDSWPVSYRGEWDVRGQNLKLETVAAPGRTLPVAVEVNLSDYLSAPRWAVKATLQDMPASPLVETARRFGVPLPAGIRVEGKVNGAIAYAGLGVLNGQLNITGGSVASENDGQAATARMDAAALDIQDHQITFGPATLSLDGGESAALRASYDLSAQKLSLRLETDKLSMEQVQSGAIRALGVAPPPLLSACRQGAWRGWVDYEWQPAGPGTWSGRFELMNTEMPFPDLAAPLRITSANVAVDGAKVQASRLRGRVGRLVADGDFRYDPESAKPAFLRLHLGEASMAEIERVLQPVLERQEGLLARLRIRRAALPDWLKQRRIEGAIQIDELSFGEAPMGSVSGRLAWNGPAMELTNLAWKRGDSAGTGKLELNLSGAATQYRLSGRVENAGWRDGDLSFEGAMLATGSGAALLAGASAEGTFEARNVTLAPEASFDEISGTFRFQPGRAAGQLRLLNIQAMQDQEAFTGQGNSQPDGRILLELNSGKRQIRELTAGLSH